MTCAEVAAAMAMVTVRTEPNQMTVGFASRSGRSTMSKQDSVLVDLPISARQRLDDVQRSLSGLVFGGTDCAMPMRAAAAHNMEIETFVIYTDNETGHGDMHPFQALKQYRQKTGIDAKLVVVALTPTKFSIADPADPGMLDISGFDAAMPNLISDFSMGAV
jgi:60 kDa SS-A/Ro ribonucleoprotein